MANSGQFQKGNKAASRRSATQEFANMLRIALKEQDETGQPKLRAIAEKLVDKAKEGDIQAINIVADRLDGKPVQAHQALDGDGEPTGFIVPMPIVPASAEEWQHQHKPNGKGR